MTGDSALETKFKIKVYFDGLCHLCSREINHYRSMRGSENIDFQDITSATFDAKSQGLDPNEVHKNMHVRDREGAVRVGVDGFIAIWNELPSLRFLVPIASFGPIHLILRLGYFCFTKIRPMLPRKTCEESPYCEIKSKK